MSTQGPRGVERVLLSTIRVGRQVSSTSRQDEHGQREAAEGARNPESAYPILWEGGRYTAAARVYSTAQSVTYLTSYVCLPQLATSGRGQMSLDGLGAACK
jgi:hypothetical protein